MFITLYLRRLSSTEILLLDRRLSLECEVRLLTRRGSNGQAYPVRDIITNCVAHLSDDELTRVQQRITREWERRESVARMELEDEKANDDDETRNAMLPEEEDLEPMGLVAFTNIQVAETTPNARMLDETSRSLAHAT